MAKGAKKPDFGVEVWGSVLSLSKTINATYRPEITKAVLRAAVTAGAEIDAQARATFPRGTGALARSFLTPTLISDKREEVKAGALSRGSARKYASVLETGQPEIHPRTVDHLAIPLTKEARTRWPRDWGKNKLSFIQSKKGNKLLVDRAALKKKEIRPQYLLRKSVKIKPRRYIAAAFKKVEKKIIRIVNNALSNLAKKAAKEAEKARS